MRGLWLIVLLVFGTASAQLTQARLSDGTGTIGLAPGFQMGEAYRGSVSAVHPNGSTISLGIPYVVVSPDSSLLSLPSAQQSPIAYPGDLGTALREVLAKRFQARLVSLISRPAPQAIAGVPAYYAMYDFVQNGVMYAGIGYFTTLSYGPNDPWQMYSSVIVAPRANFAQMYPALMAMWRSWRPNGQEPLAGSQSAKIEAILKDSRQSYEKMQEAFRKNL